MLKCIYSNEALIEEILQEQIKSAPIYFITNELNRISTILFMLHLGHFQL